ncbi:hypothetical protein DLAC_10130 [Tieghemostelium lacteum]|uniref:AMP-dependent synthetase/ligase domain-containing protein n=1 Tax=Tieghemostelium lacteum TaxID=361077 RepID=A0A151Z672_TIELA|nr:hypothetical protein DLAC_10130 [Tieghemostelium lacteum]|eukprot:KYQ89459.1 hypothetical protein DLAC_10130 [Tieghemostelium lacteum]
MEENKPVVDNTTTTTTTTTTTSNLSVDENKQPVEQTSTSQPVEQTTTTSTTSTTAPTTTATTKPTEAINLKNGNPNSTIPEVWKMVPNVPVPNTMIEAFNDTVRRHPNRFAMKVKRNGTWITWTWTQYRQQVFQIAKGLLHLGLSPKGGTNIIGFNSPEWHIAFLGSMYAGGVPTGVYTTSSPSQCEYFTLNSEAQVIFVEDELQLAKYIQVRDKIPNVRAIIVMTPLEDNPRDIKSAGTASSSTDQNGKEPKSTGEGSSSSSSKPVVFTKSTYPERVYTWETFLQLGREIPDERVEQLSKSITSNDILTLIYTSGTTSLPKGVVLTQENVVWTVYTIAAMVFDIKPERERFVSYLPLSHIAEQVVTLHAPVMFGVLVCFADRDALQGSLLNTLLEVKPTIFFGVPRVWEKIQLKITSIINSKSSMQKKLIGWAQGKGLDGGYKSQKGEKKPRGYGLAKKLVFDTIIKNLGFQYTRLLASAAAPISKDTLNFFLSLGITVTEAFGMSELTGPQTLGYPKYKTGSVGKSLPGSDIKIAEDGEICIKGPNCFKGYWKNDEATKETIDNDGWVHTGDIGRMDESGYLFITDRKKELIITAGGENIPPSLIEGFLRQIIGVEQAVVIGDRQKYLVALFTPSLLAIKTIPSYGHPLPKTLEEAATDKHFDAYINSKLAEINSKLTSAQTIKRFKILPVEFSESGVDSEITPTKKLKRKIITMKYEAAIRELYGDQYTEGSFQNNPIPIQTSPSMPSMNTHMKLDESSSIPINQPEQTTTTTTTTTTSEKVIEEQKDEESKINQEPTIVNTILIEQPTILPPPHKSLEELKVPEFIEPKPTSLIVGSDEKNHEEPTTHTEVEQPKPVEIEQPKPVEVVVVEQPKPVEIEQPKPVEIEQPKPVEEQPKPVEEQPKPVEVVVEQPKPVEVVVEQPKQVEEHSAVDEQPKPVEVVNNEAELLKEKVIEKEEKDKETEPVVALPIETPQNNGNGNNNHNDKEHDKDSSSYTSTSDSSYTHTSDSSDTSSSGDSSSYTTSSGTHSDSESSYSSKSGSLNTSELSSE